MTYEEVREKLKEYVHQTGREIIEEKDEEDKWLLAIKHGNFVVYLVHPKNQMRGIVLFAVKFPSEILSKIEKLRKDPRKRLQFDFGLRSALNSPITAFKIEFDEKGNPERYQITKSIFPFHEGFTIKELDEAIQAVVSIGVLGLDFLSSILGIEMIESQIREELRKPPPETMYG